MDNNAIADGFQLYLHGFVVTNSCPAARWPIHRSYNIRKLTMPRHHAVQAPNVDLKRLGAVLAVAYRREFHDFASLRLLEKLGPRTLQSLALVAAVIHGAPTRFSDPA